MHWRKTKKGNKMPRRTEFERKGTFEFKHVCPYCNCLNESLDKDHIGVIKCEDCNREYYVITEEMVAYNIYKKTARESR